MFMRNQKGNGTIVVLAIIAAVAIGLYFHSHRTSPVKTSYASHDREVVRLKDECPGTGKCIQRYAYHDSSSDAWFVYFLVMNNTQTSLNYTMPSSLPAGGSWVRSDNAPPKEEIETQGSVQIADKMTPSEEVSAGDATAASSSMEEPVAESEPAVSEPGSQGAGAEAADSNSASDGGGADYAASQAVSESAPADSGSSSGSSDSGGSSGSSDGGGGGGDGGGGGGGE